MLVVDGDLKNSLLRTPPNLEPALHLSSSSHSPWRQDIRSFSSRSRLLKEHLILLVSRAEASKNKHSLLKTKCSQLQPPFNPIHQFRRSTDQLPGQLHLPSYAITK